MATDGGVVTRKGSGHLQEAEGAAVVALLRRQLTVPEIAEVLGRSPETIRRVSAVARGLLEASAVEAVEGWRRAIAVAGEKGNHGPSRDLLVAIGTIEAPKTGGVHVSASATVVTVQGFKLPGIPDQPEVKNVTP